MRSSDATWTFNLRHGTSTTIFLSAGLGKVWKLSNGVAINGSVAGEWMVYRQFAPRIEQQAVAFVWLAKTRFQLGNDCSWVTLEPPAESGLLENLRRVVARFAARQDVRVELTIGCLHVETGNPDGRGASTDA